MLEKIRRNKIPWIHGGDIIEAIVPTDRKRYDTRRSGGLLPQIYLAAELMKSASKTCIGMLAGNHEESLSASVLGGELKLEGWTPKQKCRSITEFICAMAGVEPLSLTGYINIKAPSFVTLPKQTLRVFVTHFVSGCNFRAGEPERIKANRAVRLRDSLSRFDAELKLAGHIHRFMCTPPTMMYKLAPVDGAVKEVLCTVRPGWHVASPSFYRVYSDELPNYAEARLSDPTSMGWAEIDINRDGTIEEVRRYGHKGQVLETRKAEVVA